MAARIGPFSCLRYDTAATLLVLWSLRSRLPAVAALAPSPGAPAGTGEAPAGMFTFALPVEASNAAEVGVPTSISLPRVALSHRVPPEIVGGAGHDRGVIPPSRLHDGDTGRWCVTTASSAHHLDLDARTVTRIDGAGVPSPGSSITVSALRLDRESIPLLELVCCQPGYPMELLLRVRDDAVTVRRTTPVVAINPL